MKDRAIKVLVTGANGAVASDLIPCFKRMSEVLATDIDCPEGNKLGLVYMDIRDQNLLREQFKKFSPTHIVHLAAEIDVEKCEREPEHAFSTNAEGTRNVALACREFGCFMLYTSSAGVFGGRKKTPYVESDLPAPVNIYGKTKFKGEKYIQEIIDPRRYCIVRPCWMIGGGRKDKKFVAKIIRRIREGARDLKVVTDKRGVPTYTFDLCEAIHALIINNQFGIFHCACNGEISRFEIAQVIVSLLNRKGIKVIPVASKQVKEEFFAPRPNNETVNSDKFNNLFPGILRDWKDVIEHYYQQTDGFKEI